MKNLGGILAVIGIIVVVLGLLNHTALHFLGSMKSGSTYMIIGGGVLLVIGVVLFVMPRKASA